MTATEPDLAHAKRLGAFYTPPELVRPLVHWAVRADSKRVLDPSYGDGRFLVAAGHRLAETGAPDAPTRLFGSEVDPRPSQAFCDLAIPPRNLVRRDFFACSLKTWGDERFDAVVGNPPYVRHHLLASEDKTRARERMKESHVELSERADAWAYFCTYLLGFIAPEGRMALILPGSVLHADYASPVLDAWSRGDRRVRLIRVRQRLFPGVNERTVVLLVDAKRSSAVEYQEVENIPELANTLREHTGESSQWRRGVAPTEDAAVSRATRLQTRLRWFVPPALGGLWNEVTSHAAVHRLGDLAEIRIGVVSGANKFFVLNAETAARVQGRSSRLRFVPCVSRNAWLHEPVWTTHAHNARTEEPSLLMIVPARGVLPTRLRRALQEAEAANLHKRSHCIRRTPWYALQDFWAPDLFLPYMTSAAPHLVVNDARATCTNAVHRVSPIDSAQRLALAAGSWTSLFRLSAELFGRSYGGGVLKVEPGEAAETRLPLPDDAQQVHLEICDAYAHAGADAAIAVADRLVLRDQLGLTAREVSAFTSAVTGLGRRRAS